MVRKLIVILILITGLSVSAQSEGLIEYRKEKAQKKAAAKARKELSGDCKIIKDEVDQFTGNRFVLTQRKNIGTMNGGTYIRMQIAVIEDTTVLVYENLLSYCTSDSDKILIKFTDEEIIELKNIRNFDCGDRVKMYFDITGFDFDNKKIDAIRISTSEGYATSHKIKYPDFLEKYSNCVESFN